jgi:hypothetical protein
MDGGRHEGMGTHNRIVPLGPGYIELLAVADAREASGSALGAALQARIATVGEGLLGYAVSGIDVAAAAERLGTTLTSIHRDGMTARLTGVAEALREPFLPFFVSADGDHPGEGGTAGGLTWIEVAGDESRLSEWVGGAELPVRVVAGPPAVLAVGIGDREFRAGR